MTFLRCALVVLTLGAGSSHAVELVYPPRDDRSTPTLLTPEGQMIARGVQTEQAADGLLKMQVTYDFPGGRQVIERATLRTSPELAQQFWSWDEAVDGQLRRHFQVDFDSGRALAFKEEPSGPRRWSEQVPIEPGRTFAGIGFVPAIRNLFPRLNAGERVELRAVGMSPKPRVVTVEIRRDGTQRIQLGGRSHEAAHVVLHPELSPLIALLADVPDYHFWFTTDEPPQLLRSLFTLIEPGEPMVRADTRGAAGQGRTAPPAGRMR